MRDNDKNLEAENEGLKIMFRDLFGVILFHCISRNHNVYRHTQFYPKTILS